MSAIYMAQRKENEAQHQMFQRKYDNENKIVDLSSLPPCQSVLYLHTSRANFVAKVWKSADDHQLEFPTLSDHGWTDMCEIIWMTKAFPENIEELLLDLDQNEDQIEGDAFEMDDGTDDDDGDDDDETDDDDESQD